MSDKFRVNNPLGMWIRSAPIVSPETEKVRLPNGHEVTKLGDSVDAAWWRVSTTFQAANHEGVSAKRLMVPADADGSIEALIARTLAVLADVAPRAHPNYLKAIREGGPIFAQHGITTPRRMAHFLAQVMQETGSLTVLRESMNYRAPRIMEIFGVGHHSARVTAAEAQTLAHNEQALSERDNGL